MFRYAPCLEDEEKWIKIFAWLKEYDLKLKELRSMTSQLCLNDFVSKGTCSKSI